MALIKYYGWDFLKDRPGIRHVRLLIYFLLNPVYQFFKKIFVGLNALLTY